MRVRTYLFVLCVICFCATAAAASTSYPLPELCAMYLGGQQVSSVTLDAPASSFGLELSNLQAMDGCVVYRVFDGLWDGMNPPPTHQESYPIPAYFTGNCWFPELGVGRPFQIPFQSNAFDIVISPPSPVSQVYVSLDLGWYMPPPPMSPYGYSTEWLAGPMGNVGGAMLVIPEPSSFLALGSGILGLVGVIRRRKESGSA